MSTVVQTKVGTIGALFSGDGVSNEAPLSFDSNVTVGNHVLVAIFHPEIRTVTSIADTASSTYTAARAKNSGGAGAVNIWFAQAASTSAGQSVVVTLNGATGDDGLIILLEVSGLDSDQSARSTNGGSIENTSTSHNSGTVTTANEGIVLAMQSRTPNDAWVNDGGFTSVATGSVQSFYLGYIAAPTGTQELNNTSDANEFSVTQIAAFVGASGGGAFELDADQGSYSLTGQAANLNKGFRIAADQGTYSVLGSDALVDSEIDCDQGSYAISGQAANLGKGFRVEAEPGAYVLVGNDALLISSAHGPKILVCDQGSYTVTGQDTSLRRAARAIANTGLYTLSGFSVVGGTAADEGTISTIFRVRKVLIVSATGRTKWVHYIPIKNVPVTSANIATFNQEGAVEVESIGSSVGLVEWVDYIPVVEVGSPEAGRWRYDNAGWIPVVYVD